MHGSDGAHRFFAEGADGVRGSDPNPDSDSDSGRKEGGEEEGGAGGEHAREGGGSGAAGVPRS